jgi:hypothetical protein
MAIYQYNQHGILNPAESRIHHLYQWLNKGIMPWMWDHENYTGDRADMIGFFYPEDIENIKQIEHYEYTRERNKK